MAARVPAGSALRVHLLDDEQVMGSFLGVLGPRPGLERFVVAPAVLVMLLTGRLWTAFVVIGIGIAAIVGPRRYVTVVRTDQAVVRIDQGHTTTVRPDATATRLPTTAIGFVDVSGDARVVVDSEWLWLPANQRATAYRLSRIGAPPATP